MISTDRQIRKNPFRIAIAFCIIPLVLAACGGGSAATDTPAATKAATIPPTAVAPTTAAPTTAATRPAGSAPAGTTAAAIASTGTDPRGAAPAKRGGGGTLHLLYWQAPTVLNEHQAQTGNGKDQAAARVVEEPLATTSIAGLTPDVPVLAKEIPSAANGELAADGTSVTWKLKDGIKWSDGTPFTSADVKATYDYIVKKENAVPDVSAYADIAALDTPDATTVKITFKNATAAWYLPFTNYSGVVLQKAQIEKCTNPNNCPINDNPIGTGAYKVKSFTSGDNVQFVINDNYREANAPFFDAIDWKGGGDAGTAAKALIAGSVDFVWNVQVTPDVLKQVTDAGKQLDLTPGSGVERIAINFTDPNKEVDGEKSSIKAPHPFLTDPKVREALSYLVDRDNITKTLYGPAAAPTCNILPSVPPQTDSKNTVCSFDIAKANQILDDAGWKKGGDGVRAKNGVSLKVTISAAVGSVREKEEQIIKQSFQQAGITMDIKNADAGVFFGKADNPDSFVRFEKDLELFSSSAGVPDAQPYFEGWTTAQLAQKSNNWSGNNLDRFSDPQYDALIAQLKKEINPEKRAQLIIQCNDYIVGHWVEIPILGRAQVNARRADLVNTAPTLWDAASWNIAYWQIKK